MNNQNDWILNKLSPVIRDAFLSHLKLLRSAGDRAQELSAVVDLELGLLDLSNLPTAATSFRGLSAVSELADQANRRRTHELAAIAHLLEQAQAPE